MGEADAGPLDGGKTSPSPAFPAPALGGVLVYGCSKTYKLLKQPPQHTRPSNPEKRILNSRKKNPRNSDPEWESSLDI